MKTLLVATILLLTAQVEAQVGVRGYSRKDGTYVLPHYRTAPNAWEDDNYSYRGNRIPRERMLRELERERNQRHRQELDFYDRQLRELYRGR